MSDPSTGTPALEPAIRAILASPVSHFFAFDELWICPMCGNVGAKTEPTLGWTDHAARHLRQSCPAIRAGKRQPHVTPDQQRKRAFVQGVRYKLEHEPAWQLRDLSGRWYCPYCAQGPLKTEGGDAFTPKDVEAIAVHVSRCPPFTGGEGEPRSAGALKPVVDQANARIEAAAARHERSCQQLMANPAAKVFSFDAYWICPMCMEVFSGIGPKSGWPELALQHVRSECPVVREGQYLPKLPADQLRKSVLSKAIPAMVQAQATWQWTDVSGRWYCPYCIQSGVKLGQPGPIQPGDLPAITDHVIRCFYFDSGRGRPKDPGLLKEAVAQANAKLEAAQDFRPKLGSDPVWQVRDRNGCWVCPYCRGGIASVMFSPSRPEDSVEDVGSHLTKHCDAFRKKLPPAKDVKDLQGADTQVKAVANRYHAERELVQVDKKTYELLLQLARDSTKARADSAEIEAVEKALDSAQRRQMKMLPKPPAIPGFEIDALYRPSHRLSGDFYDFIRIDPERFGLLIGDVSGHGVDAALVMTMVKKVISIAGKTQLLPRDVLISANQMMGPDMGQGTFASACYGLLNPKERTFRFSCAGHNPVLVFNPARGEKPIALRTDGIVLGVATGNRLEKTLEEVELPLQSGDIVILYTDGVVEQPDPKGEMLQLDGFMEIIQTTSGATAKQIVQEIDGAFSRFRGQTAQEDDVTVICVRVL